MTSLVAPWLRMENMTSLVENVDCDPPPPIAETIEYTRPSCPVKPLNCDTTTGNRTTTVTALLPRTVAAVVGVGRLVLHSAVISVSLPVFPTPP